MTQPNHGFAPPVAALSLYDGTVMHARMKPVVHRFNYRVFTLLIDLDQLDSADCAARLFSVGRFNLVGFNAADHGAMDGSPLRPHVDHLLAQAGLSAPARVLLQCYPRILGFVFNPLSVYFCYDRNETLTAVIYEVRNTFGEKHSYVAPVRNGEFSAAGLRQQRDKLFYVSPFMEMAQRYLFRLRPPGETLAIRILEQDAQGPVLAASFHGSHVVVSDRTLAWACLRIPFLTLKVVAGIHFEALRLWWKGLRIVARPKPPAPASFDQPGPITAADATTARPAGTSGPSPLNMHGNPV